MDTAVTPPRPIDRRGIPRCCLVEEHGILLARVRPGHRAAIVDVSARGALIETGHRVLPGAVVDLHVQRQASAASVRGRVLRCSVVCVRSSGVRYRAAIAFESELSGLNSTPTGYAVPADKCPGDVPSG
jgi:hypothetical protein